MKKIILAALIVAPIVGFAAADNEALELNFNRELRNHGALNTTSPEAYEPIRTEDMTPFVYGDRGENELVKKNVEEIIVPGADARTCLNWKTCRQRAYRASRGYNGIYKKSGDEAKMAGFSWMRKDGQEYKNQLDGERSGLNKIQRLHR